MRVMLTMEVETAAALAALGCKDSFNVEVLSRGDVHEVDVLSVEAVEMVKPKRKRKRGRK